MPVPAIDRFAIVIGAMKSGTTSLFEYLAAHPEVAPCSVKEPDVFSDEARVGRGLDAYRALWDWDPNVHAVALEASTSYTMRPEEEGVPERMKSFETVEMRFIYIMRDPVERIASHLSHVATRKGGADRVGEADFRRALQVSRYAMQLDAYRAQWPRTAVLPLVYEAMVEDPGPVLTRVQEFLGLTRHPVKEAVASRAHNTRTELAADQVLSRILDRASWLRPLRRWVPEPARQVIRRAAGRWGSRTVGLTASQRERAAEALREEVVRLRDEWGVDTSLWSSLR